MFDSGTSELLELDREGRVTRRLELRSWPRELTVIDRFLYVGESAMPDQPEATASVAIGSRDDWRVVERFDDLPCEKVDDVVVAFARVAESTRRGFPHQSGPHRRAAPARIVRKQAGVRGATLSTLAQPLPSGERRVAIQI